MEAQSSERGPGKELEMGFIRDHTAEQASSELGRAGRGWAVREWSVRRHRESRPKCIRTQRTPSGARQGVARQCGWPQGSEPRRKRNRSTQHWEVDGKEVTRLVKGKEREEKQLWARMVSGKSEEEKNNFEI